ncbi:hypothetical protein Barb6_00436 [Bacteroidales bacterium Barb6]|nr:hypothetical protein Barb4_02546 [Bacteroidales bacterium Barb4]OAV73208.1 hypothetical protein Barb6_00436 [Bacteroidales bacterium Barb6]
MPRKNGRLVLCFFGAFSVFLNEAALFSVVFLAGFSSWFYAILCNR